MGILKKKHVAVHKDLEDQKQSINFMNSEHSRLENVIKVGIVFIMKMLQFNFSHILDTGEGYCWVKERD